MFQYTMSSMKSSKRIMWALPIMFAISIMNAMQVHAQINPISFEEYTLPNGLHVILHKDISAPNSYMIICIGARTPSDPAIVLSE